MGSEAVKKSNIWEGYFIRIVKNEIDTKQQPMVRGTHPPNGLLYKVFLSSLEDSVPYFLQAERFARYHSSTPGVGW